MDTDNDTIEEVPEDEELELEEPTTSVGVKEVASRCGATPKDFRRWLRTKTDRRVGQGGRWAFTAALADRLVELYEADHAPADVEDNEDTDDEVITDIEDLEVDDFDADEDSDDEDEDFDDDDTDD